MAKQGKTAKEIADRLDDLQHVLRDWRDNFNKNQPGGDALPNLPSDSRPETWNREELEKFIAMRKPKWIYNDWDNMP